MGRLARRALTGVVCGLILLGVMKQSAHAEDITPLRNAFQPLTEGYALGPLDKVRIKVYSWRASQDQIFEWTAINQNADYTVGASGDVSVPLVGEIRAAGLTPGELAADVSAALQERIGMVEKPDVAVEVVQFRPFYVIGDVEKPGEYPFRPGLSIMQATAIAGGPLRDHRADLRLEREMISGEGDFRLLLAEKTSLLARKARLESELSGRKDIAFPDELISKKSEADVATILAQENQIFKARLDGFSTQLAALQQLKSYLENEVGLLEAQIKAHEAETDTVERELQSVRSLAEKKLITETRRLSVERNRAQIEGERLRLQSNLMRVKQDIGRTDVSVVELRNKRTTDITTEIAQIEPRIEQVNHKIRTTRKLLADTEFISFPTTSNLEIVYKLVRKGKAEMTVDEGMFIEPGDTVRVEINNLKSTVVVGPVTPSR